MPSGQYFSEWYAPVDHTVPEKDRRMAEEVANDYDRRTRDAAAVRNKKVSEIVERGDRKVRDLLGDANWQALRARIRDERMKFSDLLQPPSGLTADYDKLNGQRRANVQAYFDSLKVDTKRLKAIFTETHTSLKDLLVPTKADAGHALWLHTDSGDEPAGSSTLNDPHQWFAFRPPFTGFQMGFDPHSTGRFRVSRTHALDAGAGQVGHDLALDNNDASDFDNGWGIVDTQIAFNFRAPANGLVEILIDARHANGLHHLRVEDEFGTSDSSTTQLNHLMAHVLHPNVNGPSFATMSRFEVRTDDTGVFDRQLLVLGQVYRARLFSNGVVSAGQVVQIRAGTRGEDGSITNDMEINSFTSFRWFLGTVWVRIAP